MWNNKCNESKIMKLYEYSRVNVYTTKNLYKRKNIDKTFKEKNA